MEESIEKLKKEIDRLYKLYYNTHDRNRDQQIRLLQKITALKYKIKKIQRNNNIYEEY